MQNKEISTEVHIQNDSERLLWFTGSVKVFVNSKR